MPQPSDLTRTGGDQTKVRRDLTLVPAPVDTTSVTGHLTLFIDHYLHSRLMLGTYNQVSAASVRSRLASFAAFYSGDVGSITWRDVEAWMQNLGADGMKAPSRNSYLSSLRRFFRWMVREQLIDHNPAADIDPVPEPRRQPRAQTPTAIQAVFAACQTPRDVAMIRVMVSSGLRRKEVAGADWTDYDRAREELFITGKAGHERWVPITRATSAALAALNPQTSGPIFRQERAPYGPMTPGGVGKRVQEIMVRAGVKREPFDGKGGHSLRHTAATDLLEACGNLKFVQDLLGHANLSTTGVYLGRTNLDKMRAAMELRECEVAHIVDDLAAAS